MKLKLFTGITLAVVLTTGLLIWFHYQQKPAELPISKLVKPAVTSLPRPVPINSAKMVTVATQPLPPREVSTAAPAADWEAVLLIENSDANYEARLRAIGSLSSNLSEDDLEMLQKFLLKPDPLDREQMGQVLKNNLMNVLCALNPPPGGLEDVLAKIYRDHKQDEVVRDYAVQHLAAYYEQLTGQRNNAKTLQSVQKVLWEAANEPIGSIGGTALLALKRLSQEYTGFDQGKISAKALQMAGSPIADEMTRITAYQVCAQLGNFDALPTVLKATENGDTIPVRLSAIGALGLLGGPEQISYLNNVLDGPEDRLKPAAKQALTQIAARQNQLVSQK